MLYLYIYGQKSFSLYLRMRGLILEGVLCDWFLNHSVLC